jgi:multiple sugar transport system substrate-binding protein
MSTPRNLQTQAGLSRREFLKRASAIGIGIPLLAACAVPAAPGTTGQTEGAAAPAVQPVAIEFWDMVWGPPEYVDTGKALVEQFNQ